jgi:hypothetical protein
MIADRHARVGRRVLGDETDLAELFAAAWRAAEHGDRSRAWGEQPDGELEQGRLAGAVRADQAHYPADRDLERAVGERPPPPVPLTEALCL